MKKSPKK